MDNPNFNTILSEALAKQKRITNADEIRSMSDEELAQMFWEIAACELCQLRKRHCSDNCKGTWLEWLRQEAK